MRSLGVAPQAGQFSQLEVDLLPLAPHAYAALPGTGPRTYASGGADARGLPLAPRDSSEWPASNRRPLAPKASALPTELRSAPGPGSTDAGRTESNRAACRGSATQAVGCRDTRCRTSPGLPSGRPLRARAPG